MPIPGQLAGSMLGPAVAMNVLAASGATTYAMASLNTGYCGRFIATENKDIFSVDVNFSAVTAAGSITCRIETIDGTTGKPTGTLYDANATKAFTPVTGWQTVTFDTPPTTNLTVGTQYAVVLLTTTGGTTMTLRGYIANGQVSRYPILVLTAADGTTRSNFAEVASAMPMINLRLDDSSHDPMGFFPYATTTTYNAFTTNAMALKFVLNASVVVRGVEGNIQSVGTPAGDLRVRIFDSGDNTVSNTTVTVDKDSAISGLASGGRNAFFPFPAAVTLAAGTYRVVFDSASSTSSSNCWKFAAGIPASTTVAPDDMIASLTTDVTAGPISWTDSATNDQPPVRLIIDSIPTPSGSQVGQPAATTLNGQLQR